MKSKYLLFGLLFACLALLVGCSDNADPRVLADDVEEFVAESGITQTVGWQSGPLCGPTDEVEGYTVIGFISADSYADAAQMLLDQAGDTDVAQGDTGTEILGSGWRISLSGQEQIRVTLDVETSEMLPWASEIAWFCG